ncbi:MAG TPA: phospholipase D-like domain-containing protein, partial [Bdellovibrionales bacterium]|nr:phospholipase D-like domain-containing protein [Bdellovibrionales bacterium]
FHDFFYKNVEDHDFTTVTDEPNPKPPFTKTHRVHIPIRKLLANPKYFPSVERGDVSVRLIYDNPLIDRDPRTKKHYSKFFRTLSYLSKKARQTLWISTPYLTFDRELMALFQEAAKRVDVRILTNSLETTDRGTGYYKSQISHYPAMLKAGIRVFEWKGHTDLYKVNHECPISYWPGQMLHSKLVVVDGAVSMVGSNNINRRSKLLNNEVMVLMNDEAMSARVSKIFETAFAGEVQQLQCRDGSRRSLPVVEEMTKEKVDQLSRKLGVKEPDWNYSFGGL